MKKFLCLLLALLLCLGATVISAFGEESGDAPGEENSSVVSDDPSSNDEPPVSSIDEPSSSSTDEPSSSTDDPSSGSDDPRTECAVTVTHVGDGDIRYEDKSYYIGDTLVLNISPAQNMGVKTITVNGEETDGFSVGGGAVSIELDGDIDVVVEFADAVRVIVAWGEGAQSVTANGGEIPNNSGFWVIKGSDLILRIRANANQTIDKVINNKEDVTSKVKGGVYTVKEIESGCVIDISFRESGNTEVKVYTITVNVEGKGKVDPDGNVQVEHGGSLSLTITPDEGYVVQSVSDRGRTYKVSGNSYTVKNVYEDGTVTVIFASENGENSSASDNSSTAGDIGRDYITRSEIEALAQGQDIRIDISTKTKIGKDALSYINELVKSGKSVAIGVSGKYWWMLPEDANFAVASLADDGINFGVLIDSGNASAEMKALIAEKSYAQSYGNVENVTIERISATALPDGTRLKVYMGDKFSPGQRLDWLKYSTTNKKFTQMCDVDGALVKVDNSGYATVEMPFPEKYGMLVNYIAKYSTVTLTWNQTECSVSIIGDISVSEDGQSTNAIAWKSGGDVYITVNIKDGFAIKEIITSDFSNMQLFNNGNDVTATGAKDVTDSVTIKIKGISKDGQISITTEKSQKAAVKASATVPWDVLILIGVIVIAVIVGGYIFIVKWRQSDDDDDDDYYDDDEDEE